MKAYFVENSAEGEAGRLALRESLENPRSFTALEQLNIPGCARCLEVGCGRCGVLVWLSQHIGPTGSVVGLDIDTSLAPEPLPANARVLKSDVVTAELPVDAFDFVHSRLVLMHLDERDRVLEKLVGTLAPAGTLFLEEGDAFPLEASRSELLRRVWEQPAKRWRWARALPERLQEMGLVDVRIDVEAPIFQGGSPRAQFYASSIATIRGRLQARDASLTDELIDAAIAQLHDPTFWTPLVAMCRVSGRRPDR